VRVGLDRPSPERGRKAENLVGNQATPRDPTAAEARQQKAKRKIALGLLREKIQPGMSPR